MSDTIKLVGSLGNIVEIPIEVPGKKKSEESLYSYSVNDTKDKPSNFSRKDDLIVSIRVAAMQIYTRADKYVDEFTDPASTFISIEFDENGIPSVSVNKTEHVVTSNHVENSLDIKQMWREENC